ncbi:MAG: hypothetical protein AAGH99_08715 [Planctomycetota bacterium]
MRCRWFLLTESVAACAWGIFGPAVIATAQGPAPTLIDMQVEAMPEVDPKAPIIEYLEVKAVRNEANADPYTTVSLRGTLARPAGLDHAYGPLGWAATEALDDDGHPLRFTTEGYASPDKLLNEPVDELYRRVGPTMARIDAQRLHFDVHLKGLEYLTPRLERLALRSYAIVADDEQTLDVDLPAIDGSAEVAGAWVLTVVQLDERQELLLHAVDAEPSVWPLRLELIDAEGRVLSTGFRRGTDTRDDTMATQWRFSQPTLVADGSAAGSDGEEEQVIPDWRLRVHHAAGLRLQQLDAVLGNIKLLDLDRPAENE